MSTTVWSPLLNRSKFREASSHGPFDQSNTQEL
jgi:hypothetical protein